MIPVRAHPEFETAPRQGAAMRDVLHVGEGRCREGRQREKHNFGSVFSLKSVLNKQQSSYGKGPLLSCLALSF